MENLSKKLKGKKSPSPKYESITNPLYMPGDGPPIEMTTGSPLTSDECNGVSSDCKALGQFESAFEYGKPGAVSKRYQSIFTYEGNSDEADNKMRNKYNNFDGDTTCEVDQAYSNSFYYSITTIFSMILVVFFPFLAWFYVKIVNQEERVLVYRLGKLTEPRGPGVVFLLPLIDKWKRISLQEQTITVNKVSGATRDGGVVEMDGKITYRIDSPTKLTNMIQNAEDTLRNHGHSCLLQVFNDFDCNTMPSATLQLANQWKHSMNKQTVAWGVAIINTSVTIPQIVRPAPDPISFLEKINIQAIGRQFAMYAPMFANMGNSGAAVTTAAAAINGHIAPLPDGADGENVSVPNAAAMDKFLEQLELIKQQALASQNSQSSQKQFQQLIMLQQQQLLSGKNGGSSDPQSADLLAAFAANTRVSGNPPQIMPGTSTVNIPGAKPVRQEDSLALIDGLMAQSRLALSDPEVKKKFTKLSFQFIIEGLENVPNKTGKAEVKESSEASKELPFFIDGCNGMVGEGKLENAKTTVCLNIQDLVPLMNATLSPFAAYQTGRIRISGDLLSLRVLPIILQCTA